MAEDEANMRLYRARKKVLIEDEIENSQLYKNLMVTLSNFPDIKFDMEDMISAYMDFDQSTTNADLISGNIEPTIQLGLINDVIRGTIYTISKEENGLVLDDNGTVNIEETVKSRLMAQYNFIGDFDSLTEEQQRMLMSQIGDDLGVEKIADVFIDHTIAVDRTFNWLGSYTTELDREFYNNIFNGIMDTAAIQAASDDFAIKNIDSKDAKMRDEKLSKDQFLESGTGEIEYQYYMSIIRNSKDPEEKAQILKQLAKNLYVLEKNYLKNGKMDIVSMQEESETWQGNFSRESNYKVIKKYYSKKKNDKSFTSFSDLPFEEKDLILRSALMLFEDKNADAKAREIALLALVGIDPKLVRRQRDENGNEIEGSAVIDDKVFCSAYNGMRSEEHQYNLKEIRKTYQCKQQEEVSAHLAKLVEKERNGELISKEEYMGQTKEEDLLEFSNEMEEVDNQKGKLIERSVQKRLQLKLDETLSSLTDDKGEELSYTRKVNTVMATYLILKESISKFGFDVGNREVNKKAFELLEEHIKQDPITYGKYISETTDENGNHHREITIKDNALADYRGNNAKYKEDVNSVIEVVRDMALRELTKSDKFKERMTKDGIERMAEDFKDGVKHFINESLIRVVGKEKAEEMIDSVKRNEAYKGTKRGVYALFRGAYGLTKAIGKVASLEILRPNERLALPSADHKLRVKDVDKIIDNTKNTNFIRTEEELKLVSIAVRSYDKATPEAKKVYEEEIKKMRLAKKYKDEQTGEIDVQKAIGDAKKWKGRYLNQKRGEGIQDYTDLRRSGKKFSEFTPEDKGRIFRSALMAFMDDTTNTQLKNLAGAIMEEIDPQILTAVKKGEDSTKLCINEGKLLFFYNSTFDGPKCKSVSEIVTIYKTEEDLMAEEKISRLQRQGLKSKEEWQLINDSQRAEKRNKRFLNIDSKVNDRNMKALSSGVTRKNEPNSNTVNISAQSAMDEMLSSNNDNKFNEAIRVGEDVSAKVIAVGKAAQEQAKPALAEANVGNQNRGNVQKPGGMEI